MDADPGMFCLMSVLFKNVFMVQRHIDRQRNIATQLKCHMGSHSVTCHPTEVAYSAAATSTSSNFFCGVLTVFLHCNSVMLDLTDGDCFQISQLEEHSMLFSLSVLY